MLKTYTLFLRDVGDGAGFEPALCGADHEAMARAGELLALHPECSGVDVFFGDSFLFRVER